MMKMDDAEDFQPVHFRERLESPKENWRVFEDTQPAIIEAGQWERVQALRSNKRRMTKIGRTSIFPGLVRCADCGTKLYFCTNGNYADGRKDHFVCSNYKSNMGSCQIHYIRETRFMTGCWNASRGHWPTCVSSGMISHRSFWQRTRTAGKRNWRRRKEPCPMQGNAWRTWISQKHY